MSDATDHTSHDETGTNSTSAETTSTPVTSISMPEVGQRIGPNRILELIAEGGMANVYKVWHEGLEIVRAIKILKPGFSEESKQRLHTEAKISAHLHHTNIVEIYGVSFWKDVVPYLEMEYIDGFSLKDLLKYQKQAHFTFAASVGYFMCIALNYAHSQTFTLYGKLYQGVVHRDIKPANILLSRAGTVKLADFGIAKPSEISLHTVGQKVMGTFSYLSPEQLNGDPLDYRCDVYSLGAVLYEIVTGSKAFPQKVLSELIQKKMLNEYKPANAFDIDIPKQLCSIIDKCMELKKEKRYASAPDVAEDLSALLKKCTSKTPEQIVIDYVKNPKAPVQLIRKKTFTLPVVIAGIMVICIALTFSGLIVMPMLRQEVQNTLFHTSPPATQHAAPATQAPAPHNPQPQFAPVPHPTPAAAIVAPPVREAPQASPGREEVAKRPVFSADGLKAGLAAARAKRYNEAIMRLEKTLLADLTEAQRSDATIALMESYLATGDAAGALRHTGAHFISDGYFHLLCGKTFVLVGKYERAIEAFGAAQTTVSHYNASTLQEATFLWAKTLDQIYKLKPNAENKNAYIRAWRQFAKAFCSTGASEHCAEAQRRISSFTP